MSPLKKIGKNLVFKTTTELVSRVMAFAFYILLARWLGDVAFGTFSLVYSVLAVLVFLVDPGLNLLLIRQGTKEKGFIKSSLSPILAMKLTLSLTMAILATIYGFIGEFDGQVILMFFLLGIQMAGFAITEYTSAIFQSQEKMQYETIIMGVSKIAVIGLAAVALIMGAGLLVTIAVMTLVQSVTAFCSLIFTAKQGHSMVPAFDLSRWKGLLAQAIPLAAVSFLIIAFYRIDIAIAPFLGMGLAEIGWYSSGVKLLDVALAVPTLAMAAAFPTLSRLASEDRVGFVKLSNLALLALAIAGMLCTFMFVFLANDIVTIIFGKGFESSITSTKWLGVASFFIFLRHGLLNMLILDGGSKVAIKLAALGLLVNIVFNLVLIPSYGGLGAAWTKVVTDLVICSGGIWAWYILPRQGNYENG